MGKAKILQNLKTTEENWNSKTTYEIVNEIRIAVVDLSNMNFYGEIDNEGNAEVLSKINEMLYWYLNGKED